MSAVLIRRTKKTPAPTPVEVSPQKHSVAFTRSKKSYVIHVTAEDREMLTIGGFWFAMDDDGKPLFDENTQETLVRALCEAIETKCTTLFEE